MDYRQSATEVLNAIGGSENIISAAHCATRLRLVIADNTKVNKEVLNDIDGVKGVFEAQGQLQIIFGTGIVNKVYAEFVSVAGISAATKEDVKKAAANKSNIFQRMIKVLGDIFVPIIPAIVASGFLMGIMNALDFMVNSGILNLDTESSIYVFANLFSNVAYIFLPILIGFSAAKVFGGNQYLGAVIGMIMIHPNLQNAWTVAEQGVQKTQSVFFGIWKINMIGYQGSVIPIVISVFLMCLIEKKLHKTVPAMLDLFVTPLVSVFATAYLALSVIGPVFVTVEHSIIGAIQWLIAIPLGIGSFFMGALYAPTVVMGIHHMYTVIDLGQIASYGLTFWLPLASAANIAQGAAALAVGVKTKDKKLKSLCYPSAISAMLGITEPAIFGVNLRFFKPFIAGCIGGAIGAMFAAVTGLGATGTGVTGIFGILLFLHQPLTYIILFIISCMSSFIISWLITPSSLINEKADKGADTDKATVNNSVKAKENINDEVTNDKEFILTSPLYGAVVSMEETGDPTFAAGILGKGVAIIPEKGMVYAPGDGNIIAVMGHAVGIKLDKGPEIIIHVGINTVALEGKHYSAKVSMGDRVKKGDELLGFDIDAIKAEGYPIITPVIVTNTFDYKDVLICDNKQVKVGDEILRAVSND